MRQRILFPWGNRIVKRWECQICGFVYDESEGLPDEGIVPGTRWEDIPDDWECPDCSTGKSEFEMIELVA
jgi:rubredoxin